MFTLFIRSRILCFAVALAGSGLFAADTGTLRGTVTDDSGAAVDHALITLHQIAGSAVLTANSDGSGRFSFSAVAAGQYLLEASAPGLAAAQSDRQTIAAGESKDVAVRLAVATVKTQVSVTAAGEPQSVDQVSKTLDVLTVESAERRGLFSVADALRFVPGLRVSTRGSPGTYTTIQTRGLRIQDTAVLFDDFPFRDPTSPQDEASAYLGDLMLVDSSRIEVLRGSGSSLYGTNAMSGTVNVITDPGGGPVHADLDVQGGGLGLFRGVARVAGGVLGNRLTYSGGVSHLNVTKGVDDWGAVRDWSGQGGIRYALTPKIRLGMDVFANTGYLRETISPSSLLAGSQTGVVAAIPLSLSQMRLADASQPFSQGSATFEPSLGDPDAGRYSHFVDALFRLDHEVNSRFSYRVAYGLVTTDRNNTDGPGGPSTASNGTQPPFNTSDRYQGRVDTAQARANYLLGSHQILTGGYEFTQERYLNVAGDQNPDPTQRIGHRTDDRQRFHSLSAQDEVRFLGGRLEALVSGRFTAISLDQPSVTGGGLNPYAPVALPSPRNSYTGDASVAYLLPGASTKLRAHAGNSFRMPSLYERFGGYFFGGQLYAIGDPRLTPERAVGADFGFDQYLFHDRLKVSGTYFYSHLQQVIGYLSFPPTYVDPYGRSSGYYNKGGGVARGVELSGEFRPARHTVITASYTYTNARDRTSQFYTGTEIDPLQVPRVLPSELKIVATQQLGKRVDAAMDFDGGSSYLFPLYGYAYTATTAFRFKGPRQLGLSGGYTVPLGERVSARFYVRASNALNQDYYEDGFRTPGATAVGGLRLTF